MKLSAPKGLTLIIALVIFVLGALIGFGVLGFLAPVWGMVAMCVAFALLALATLIKGL